MGVWIMETVAFVVTRMGTMSIAQEVFNAKR